MTDFRRLLLLFIFSGSVFLLFEGWQKANGRPSMLGAPPAKTASPAAGSATSPSAPSATGVPSVAGATSAANTVPSAATGAALLPPTPSASTPGVPNTSNTTNTTNTTNTPSVPRQQVTLTTDVVKATFDSLGGELVMVEFPKHAAADGKPGGVVLLSNNNPAERIYTARSGLINVKQTAAFYLTTPHP
jgi:YidC/Oxa1 family membrane protein insertase